MQKRLSLLGLVALGAIAIGCQQHDKDHNMSDSSSTGMHEGTGGGDMSTHDMSTSAPATQPSSDAGAADAPDSATAQPTETKTEADSGDAAPSNSGADAATPSDNSTASSDNSTAPEEPKSSDTASTDTDQPK